MHELLDRDEDSDEPEEDEDLLAIIHESLNPSDETGAPVSERLAKLVNEKFTLDFYLQKRKSIMENYRTPKNCDQLFSPRVNPEIWGKLQSSVKRTDIKSSVLQEILLSVSSAMVNTMEALLESKEKKALPNYKALLSTLTDSIALLGHVHKEMSFNRRDALRYHLNPEFRQACSRVVKPTGFLFGDDLSKTIQDIRATNKVVNTVSTGTPSNRESSRFKNHQAYQTTARKPFLWQRGRGTYPPRNDFHQGSRQQQASSAPLKKKFMNNSRF